MSVEIINNYSFAHESGPAKIFELKFCDVKKDAPKDSRYQWYLIIDNRRYDLEFVSMNNSIRSFCFHDNPSRIPSYINLCLANKTIELVQGNDHAEKYSLV